MINSFLLNNLDKTDVKVNISQSLIMSVLNSTYCSLAEFKLGLLIKKFRFHQN